MPYPKPDQDPYILRQLRDLLVEHPGATVIWAHAGLGRVVRPVHHQLELLDRALANPELRHLHIDISWDETAKYITSTPESLQKTAALISKYPDRFLFGSDVVAPASLASPMAVYDAYAPLWKLLTPEASRMVRLGNYERLFDAARVKVRAWERANLGKRAAPPPPSPSSGYNVPAER
jgi:hypothetical protein